jgi:hypothetical protein
VEAEVEHEVEPETPKTNKPRSKKAAAGGVDPSHWWGALTDQFQHIATHAMNDMAHRAQAHAATASAKPAARKPAARKTTARQSTARTTPVRKTAAAKTTAKSKR